MPFYATEFIFDGIPSEEYGLIISSDSGESSNEASHNVELITDEIYRRHTPYFYGVKQSQMLRLPGSIRSVNGEITAEDSAYIQSWLFGQMTFKELKIIQPDMDGFYFKCFLLDPEIVRVGNIIIGYDFTIQLDSPFAYGENNIQQSLISNSGFRSPDDALAPIYVNNLSNSAYYTYPTLSIEMMSTFELAPYSEADEEVMQSVKIVNETDNNREFFIGSGAYGVNLPLTVNEYLVINGDLQTILSYTDNTATSLTGKRRVQLIKNGLFFRLLPGLNKLYIYGHAKNITLSYTHLKRIT